MAFSKSQFTLQKPPMYCRCRSRLLVLGLQNLDFGDGIPQGITPLHPLDPPLVLVTTECIVQVKALPAHSTNIYWFIFQGMTKRHRNAKHNKWLYVPVYCPEEHNKYLSKLTSSLVFAIISIWPWTSSISWRTAFFILTAATVACSASSSCEITNEMSESDENRKKNLHY